MRPTGRSARYARKSSALPKVKNGACDREMRRRSMKFSGGTQAGSPAKTAKGTASQSLAVRASCTGVMLRAALKSATGSSARAAASGLGRSERRSEEHTSELQSHLNLVCRLLLEKKK